MAANWGCWTTYLAVIKKLADEVRNDNEAFLLRCVYQVGGHFGLSRTETSTQLCAAEIRAFQDGLYSRLSVTFPWVTNCNSWRPTWLPSSSLRMRREWWEWLLPTLAFQQEDCYRPCKLTGTQWLCRPILRRDLTELTPDSKPYWKRCEHTSRRSTQSFRERSPLLGKCAANLFLGTLGLARLYPKLQHFTQLFCDNCQCQLRV